LRGDGRINRVLVAVRGFLSFAVVNKEAPQWVLGAIYELADIRDLPLEAQSENGCLFYRMSAWHHLQEPDTAVDRTSDEEIVALFAACFSARDQLVVLLLSRAGEGLRRNETAGLRRSDLHCCQTTVPWAVISRAHACM
jgi:integrase/recombinase XerD